MRAHGIAFVVFLAGCASEVDPPITAEVDVEASPSPTEMPPAPKRSTLDGWHLPGSAVTLDAACESPATAEKGAAPLCNDSGKIAMEYRPQALGDQVKPPCSLRPLEVQNQKGLAGGVDRRSICVDGDHLIVSSLCLYCRTLDAGSSYHARLSAMGPAQHAWLHSALLLTEYDEQPTTAEGWRRLAETGNAFKKR